MLKKFFAVFFSIILILLTACTEGAEPMKFNDESSISCIAEGNWTEFFNRTGTTKGWLCADGIYSVALNGNDAVSSADSETKTLFIFSDTLIGSSDNVGKITSSAMVNHSVAVLEGNIPNSEKMTFYYGFNASGKTSNLFGQDQWLFDMFVFRLYRQS